ncbi:hypothetical protein K443DRAFT_112826 [Laccaria amethystina LaAM-08-1]|uniref:Uncharacterized protein n=1 Tax=Laccaria amethystina LaAM-08-1 TaxID=1095629 RepID=A0A0C9WPM0_9AGAR|nr:hypothetical protein K443DRAFT_112826 [Laccaria amethystina LaAM-08-1]
MSLTRKLVRTHNKNPDCGKPSIFVGERQSSALVLLKKSSRSGVINEFLRKLREIVSCSLFFIVAWLATIRNALSCSSFKLYSWAMPSITFCSSSFLALNFFSK